MRITRRDSIAAAAGCFGLAATSPLRAAKASRQPRALLMGDSISIGYTDFVVGMLDHDAEVHRPLNAGGGYLNCEGTTKGLANIDAWLGDRVWDAIHFNFGLHDLKHVDASTGRNSRNPDDPQQASPARYGENLESIVTRLKATGAKLIFATTTPYPDDSGGPLRDQGQAEAYNAVALPIMRRHGVEVNDLYALAKPRMGELFPPRNVHPKKAGYLVLARQVVAHLRPALGIEA